MSQPWKLTLANSSSGRRFSPKRKVRYRCPLHTSNPFSQLLLLLSFPPAMWSSARIFCTSCCNNFTGWLNSPTIILTRTLGPSLPKISALLVKPIFVVTVHTNTVGFVKITPHIPLQLRRLGASPTRHIIVTCQEARVNPTMSAILLMVIRQKLNPRFRGQNDTGALPCVGASYFDDDKDSFQKFTHLGQATDNQRLSCFGLSVTSRNRCDAANG